MYEDGGVLVYELSDITDDEKFKARAKHILLRFNDQNKSEVRSEANRILSLLRNSIISGNFLLKPAFLFLSFNVLMIYLTLYILHKKKKEIIYYI